MSVEQERWQEAQASERNYWETASWRQIPVEQRISEWSRHLGSLDLRLDQFAGQAILDVGCGPTGVVNFVTADRRVGLDPLVSTYRQWNGIFGEPVELIDSQAESMPFEDDTFDTVFCINCIDHTQQPGAILDECARVLKPGGLFVFHVDLDSPLRKLHKKVRPEAGRAHPHSMTYGWLRKHLDPHFVIEKERRDEQAFTRTKANMLYEAYWDGLMYRLTKADMWRNHIWLRGKLVDRSSGPEPA